MSNRQVIITHPGIVKQTDNDRVFVMILAQSACASCHAKGMCSVSDMEEKIIEVYKQKDRTYKPGDQVSVIMKKSLGNKAVFIAYFLPFLIVLAALFILVEVTQEEGLSALIALALLVPYYIIIYYSRDKLKKTFMFSIE